MNGQLVAPATDVYALGLLLYRALTGRLPWRTDTTTQMLRAHRYAEPPPLPPVNGVPEQVASLCRRCLAKDPAERPTSAQVAAGLSAALDALPTLGLGPERGELHAAAATRTSPPLLPRPTELLPTSVQEPLSTRVRPAGRKAPARRRAELVLVGAGLLLVSGLAWAGTIWSPGGDEIGQSQNLALGAGQGTRACEVEHRVQQDTGQEFTASITVKNTGSRPLKAWVLTFDLPADQRLTSGTGGHWNQDGRSVTARADHPDEESALQPNGTARLSYSTGYRGASSPPDSFAVNGGECATILHGTSAVAQTGGGGGGTGRAEDRGNDKGGAVDKTGNGKRGRGGDKGRGR